MKTVIASLVLGLASTAALAAPQYYDPYDRDERARYDRSDRDSRYYRTDTRYDTRYDNRYADRCERCGRVISIQRYGYRDRGSNSPAGAIVGALVGGALGNQVGSGNGRKAATIAGAVAGGVAGNKIARDRGRRGGEYEMVVQMDDGRRVVVAQRDLNGIREGDRVLIRNGRARHL